MPEHPDTPVPDAPGGSTLDPRESLSPDAFLHEMQIGMTLERVIELTGEFEHLNCLVMRHIEKAGGFGGTGAYFKTVQPILDMLEVEIRVRCRPGMNCQQVKLIVQDWIDLELRDLK